MRTQGRWPPDIPGGNGRNVETTILSHRFAKTDTMQLSHNRNTAETTPKHRTNYDLALFIRLASRAWCLVVVVGTRTKPRRLRAAVQRLSTVRPGKGRRLNRYLLCRALIARRALSVPGSRIKSKVKQQRHLLDDFYEYEYCVYRFPKFVFIVPSYHRVR